MRFILFIWLVVIASVLISCQNGSDVPGGSGLIEATHTVISAETAGRLQQLRFDEGDHISVGDTIAVIDTITPMLRLQQAEAIQAAALTRKNLATIDIEQADQNLKLAKKEFDRIASLLPTGAANQQQYDAAENSYEQAKLAGKRTRAALAAADADLARVEAEIALLAKQFADCFPTAPVRGIIVNKFIKAGELAGPGAPLLEIARLDTVWVKIYLPPQDLTRLKLGGRAEIDPEDGRDSPLSGHVSWIAARAEFTPKNVQTKQARADLVYAVKITIPNPQQRLKIGMPVAVRIP